MNRDLALNYVLLAAIALIWGSQYLLIEIANDSFPPFSMAACRFLIGALTLSLLLPWLEKPTPPDPNWPTWKLWGFIAVIAFFDGTIPFACLPFGERHVPSDIASIFMGMTPIFTLIFARFLIPGECFTWQAILSIALGMYGVLLLVGFGDAAQFAENIIPQGAILLSSASLAFALILLRWLPRGNAVRKTYILLVCAAVQALILAFIFEKPLEMDPEPEAWLLVITMGVLPSAIVTLLYILLNDRAGPTFTSLNNYLVPLVGVFVGMIFMHRELEPNTWLALGVIFAAMAVKELKFPKLTSTKQH